MHPSNRLQKNIGLDFEKGFKVSIMVIESKAVFL